MSAEEQRNNNSSCPNAATRTSASCVHSTSACARDNAHCHGLLGKRRPYRVSTHLTG